MVAVVAVFSVAAGWEQEFRVQQLMAVMPVITEAAVAAELFTIVALPQVVLAQMAS
jgi:hypothetical protein